MSLKSIKQINGNYLPEPDRILLRVSSMDDNEYLFLLTRRITFLLIDEFEKRTAHAVHPHDIKFSTNDLQALRQEIKAQQTDLSVRYEGAKKQPLGKTPHLISSFKLGQNKNEQSILKLYLRGHGSMSFVVNPQLMRIALQFLNQIQIKAAWNIDSDPFATFSSDWEPDNYQKSKLH